MQYIKRSSLSLDSGSIHPNKNQSVGEQSEKPDEKQILKNDTTILLESESTGLSLRAKTRSATDFGSMSKFGKAHFETKGHKGC